MNEVKHFSNIIPFDKIYQSSLKEASRKKPVFFIHKYFARRITANFRMALLDYIYSNEHDILEKFYLKSGDVGKNITILDPFMGGGTTIFEALRFKCKVIGNDLQPLSYFVTKALIEDINTKKISEAMIELENKVGSRIKELYNTKCTQCNEQADIMYAFHVKKVKCACSENFHRLFSSYIISFKSNIFTIVCPECGEIGQSTFKDGCFECKCGWTLESPSDSYVNKGKYVCGECGETKNILDSCNADGYPHSTDIIAIEFHCPHCNLHDYKKPDTLDLNLYKTACNTFEHEESNLPIPQQTIPVGYNTNQIKNHGYRYFKELFNKRQLLALGLLLKEINNIKDLDVKFWLQLAFSGMLEMNNMFCRYQKNAYKICNIFFNHAYVPITMPTENCVWGAKLGTGTFTKTLSKILRGKAFNKKIYDIAVEQKNENKFDSIKVFNGDALAVSTVKAFDMLDSESPLLLCSDSKKLLAIPDNSVDLVVTDPPYGANVMYSELIDFFHVWNYMSSSASEFGFNTPLSPKDEEIIVNNVHGKDYSSYQKGLSSVFSECYKKLKSEGYLIFSFHDKNLDSWLSMLNSVYSSGFQVIKAYPVQAETRTGAHTSGKNSISIDIMLVCKKITADSLSKELSKDALNGITSSTIEHVLSIVNKLVNVKAQLTVGDIENIVIGEFFSKCSSYKVYSDGINELAVLALNKIINHIEDNISKDLVIQKRTGWWSELFKEKWNV